MSMKTVCIQADEREVRALLKRLADTEGVRVLDEYFLRRRCALQNELERYRRHPETFVPYHLSMEAVDRWLAERNAS